MIKACSHRPAPKAGASAIPSEKKDESADTTRACVPGRRRRFAFGCSAPSSPLLPLSSATAGRRLPHQPLLPRRSRSRRRQRRRRRERQRRTDKREKKAAEWLNSEQPLPRSPRGAPVRATTSCPAIVLWPVDRPREHTPACIAKVTMHSNRKRTRGSGPSPQAQRSRTPGSLLASD